MAIAFAVTHSRAQMLVAALSMREAVSKQSLSRLRDGCASAAAVPCRTGFPSSTSDEPIARSLGAILSLKSVPAALRRELPRLVLTPLAT